MLLSSLAEQNNMFLETNSVLLVSLRQIHFNTVQYYVFCAPLPPENFPLHSSIEKYADAHATKYVIFVNLERTSLYTFCFLGFMQSNHENLSEGI